MKDTVKIRDISIDIIRYIALVLMVFSHANTLLHINYFGVNQFLQELADSFSFVALLFCFGASLVFSSKKSFGKFATRVLLLYIVHIIVSVLFLIDKNILSLSTIWEYALFLRLPEYGEFIVAFLLYEVIFYFFKDLLLKISKNIYLLCMFSVILFTLGYIGSRIDLSAISALQLLISGRDNAYSFPILQYFPVLLLGMSLVLYGGVERMRTSHVMVGFIGLSIVNIAFQVLKSTHEFFAFDRWTPTILFLFVNLYYCMSILLVYKIGIDGFKLNIKKILSLITVPSKYILYLFPVHLIIIYLLKWIGIPEHFLVTYGVVILILVPFYVLYYIQQRKTIYTTN